MHSHYCDGEGELESYVQSAIKKRMYAIGFSSHAPVPFKSDWHMQSDRLDNYISEIEYLKEKYREMNIYSGLEVDYIPGIIGPKTFADRDLDLVIGSVHYTGQFENQHHCCIEGTTEEFEMTLEQVFNNDIRKLVTSYYERVIEMVKYDPPDIIGHLDVIKKLNSNNRYFSEEELWYQDIIDDVTKAIADSDCIIEVNTRGFYKGITKEFYPGKQLLQKCVEREIPVTINSDAHHPHEIDRNYRDVVIVLSDIGIHRVVIFDKGRWTAVRIKENESEV